jgi:hypothetical protein
MGNISQFIPIANEIFALIFALISFFIWVKITIYSINSRIEVLEKRDSQYSIDFQKLEDNTNKWMEKVSEIKEGFAEIKLNLKHSTSTFNETTKVIAKLIGDQEKRLDKAEERTEKILQEIKEELKNKQDKNHH